MEGQQHPNSVKEEDIMLSQRAKALMDAGHDYLLKGNAERMKEFNEVCRPLRGSDYRTECEMREICIMVGLLLEEQKEENDAKS